MMAEELVLSSSEPGSKPSSAIRWLRRMVFVSVLLLCGPLYLFLLYVGVPIRISYFDAGNLLLGIWIATRARSVPWMALIYLFAFVFGAVATSNLVRYLRTGSMPIFELNDLIVVLASLREPLAYAMLLVPMLYVAKMTVFERSQQKKTTGKLSILDVMLFTGLVALALSWESLVVSLLSSKSVGGSFWARNEVFLSSLIPRCSMMMAVTVLIWGQCRSWRFAWVSLALAIVLHWAVWLFLVLLTTRFSLPTATSFPGGFTSVLEELGLVLVALVTARLMGIKVQELTTEDN